MCHRRETVVNMTCREGADEQEVSVRHSFSLVTAPVEGTPRSTVYIRLLGPFSARYAYLAAVKIHVLHTCLM